MGKLTHLRLMRLLEEAERRTQIVADDLHFAKLSAFEKRAATIRYKLIHLRKDLKELISE